MKRITLEIVTAEEAVEETINCDLCVLHDKCYAGGRYAHYDCPLYSLLEDEDEAESSMIKTIKTEKI